LVALMNSLGILIDITHATAQAQKQIIDASTAPVVASNTALAAVSGCNTEPSKLELLMLAD
jgi:microsomal dipeptidase-like Zn-dependent dipeptidase